MAYPGPCLVRRQKNSDMPATRWRYNKGKGVLGYNFRTESPTVKNFISTDAHKSAASFEIGHAHLRIYTFFATSQKLCQSPKHTPPTVFARFGRNQKHYALPTPTSKSWSNNFSTTIGRPNGSALKICENSLKKKYKRIFLKLKGDYHGAYLSLWQKYGQEILIWAGLIKKKSFSIFLPLFAIS